jgi:hypothetical protein
MWECHPKPYFVCKGNGMTAHSRAHQVTNDSWNIGIVLFRLDGISRTASSNQLRRMWWIIIGVASSLD